MNEEIIEPSEILLPEGKKTKKVVEANPWVRFLARMADYSFLSLVWLIVKHSFSFSFHYDFFIPVLFFVWIPIEAFFLMVWGRTPGKLLLGLKVNVQGRRRIDYLLALKRSFLVWFWGMGLGIPIVNFFTLFHAFLRYKAIKTTSWDMQEKTNVLHHRIHPARVFIAVAIIFLSFLLGRNLTT